MGLFDKFKGIFVIIFLLIIAIIIDPNNPTVVKLVNIYCDNNKFEWIETTINNTIDENRKKK